MQEKNKQVCKFSERLKLAIKTKGITQKELADRVSVSQVTISRYMKRSDHVPDTWELYRISQALNVTMEWLLTGDQNLIESQWEKRAIDAELKLSQFRQGFITLSKTVNNLSDLLTH